MPRVPSASFTMFSAVFCATGTVASSVSGVAPVAGHRRHVDDAGARVELGLRHLWLAV